MSEQAKLPEKLSDLCEVALADLEKVRSDPRYVIDPSQWHSPDGIGRCHVCFAGAVLAGTLGMDPGTWGTPMLASPKADRNWRYLSALNMIRTGAVRAAMGLVDHARDDLVKIGSSLDRMMPSMTDPSFPAAVREIIVDLRKHGL